jgi:multimeric flavodoxin WrbA
MIRVVGVSGSPRHANTEILIREALTAAGDAPVDVETKYVSLAGQTIEPCVDCQVCASQARSCIKKDDWSAIAAEILDPIPNGLIIGSPVYFFGETSLLRAFFERCTSLLKGYWVEDFPTPVPDLSRTAAAAIAVGYHRHGGVEHTLSSIQHWLMIMGCACTGSDYIGGGAWQRLDGKDTVREDIIGMRNARATGRRVAYLAHLLKCGRDAISTELDALRDYRDLEEPHEANPL